VRHLMLVLTLAATVSSATIADGAGVSAHASGVVLGVASEKHLLRIVEGQRVDDLSYRSTLPAGVSPGARVSFSTTGHRAFHFVVSGRVDHVVVFGVVVRSGKERALRLTDASLVPLPKSRHPKLGVPAHTIVRFAPVTSGGSAPTTPGTGTTPTGPSDVGCATSACSFDVTGSVSDVEDGSGAITVMPLSGGAALTALPGTLNTDDVFKGDFVHITGTQSAATGTYTLATLDELPGCDTPDCIVEFDATVDEIDSDSLIVADIDGDEYPIGATAAQLRAVEVDDEAHILAVQDPSTGDYSLKTISVLAKGPQ
jgi:hypothetical protein